MSHPENSHSDRLMELLRDHLERQERSLEVTGLAVRILAAVQRNTREGSNLHAAFKRPRIWLVWTLGVGSLVLSACLLIWLVFMPSAEVQAEQAIRQAEEVFQLPLERHYLVEVRPENESGGEQTIPMRTMQMWATGDKFRTEVTRGSFRWVWGRDADGTVWVTWHSQRGLRIAPDEQGPALRWACELFSLRPEALLSHILAHCRLREDDSARRLHRRIIYAEPKPWSRQIWLRRAVVELDAETKSVLKLTLTRINKSDGSTAVVTFTLVDVRPVEHRRYELEGNLVEPFQIYDRHYEPDRRSKILSRLVGPNVDAWLLPEKARPQMDSALDGIAR